MRLPPRSTGGTSARRSARRTRYELGLGSDDDQDYGDAEDSDEARSLALARALAGGSGGGARSSRRSRKVVDYSYKGFDNELDDAMAGNDPHARRRRGRSSLSNSDPEDSEARAKRFCKE